MTDPTNDAAAAAARTGNNNGMHNALLLRCTRCGLVLNNPESGLLRCVQDEAHNGRCLFCFPLPTRENITEMRRLQVEEYRLRLETTRGHGSEAVVPPTDDQASAGNTRRNSTLVTDAITAATDRNTTFNAVTQAMPVTPAAIGCQRNDEEYQVSPAAPSVDSQAQGHTGSYGLRPCRQDEGQGQATARFRPRTLLNDDDVNAGQTDGHGADHNETLPSTQENAETDEQKEEEDMAAEDAATGSLQDASTSHLQSIAPSPSLATASAAAAGATAGGGRVPNGSLFSIVAMFEAQEREDNGGIGDDGGIEEIIMAIDGDRTKGGEDEGGSDHKNINSKRKDPPCKSDASTTESVNGSFLPSVTAPAGYQQKPPSESLSPVENESDGEISRKRIRSSSYSALLDANDPLFKEIQTYIAEGQNKDLSVGQRDVCIEKLRMIIENEESPDTKKQHASTMISLDAPKMIVTAMQRITASFASLKKVKARNVCARYMSECCHTLATLAYYGRAQSVVDVGAIPAAISALELNAKVRNPKLYLHGMEALQTLSVCATEEILENEGLAMISAILIHLQTKISSNSSRDTKHTLRMIMRLLDNMSSSSQLGTPDERDNEDAERARVIGQRGLLKPILEVIVNLPDDLDLQLSVCSAIASLSASEDNCNDFVQFGGIRSLVFLSHRHRLSSDLQIAVVDCFAWLVADQEEHSKQACEDGVVTTCVELLKDSNMSMSVIRSALHVLDIIGDSDEGIKYLLDANAISAVTTLAIKAENDDDFRLLCQNFLGRMHGDSTLRSIISHKEERGGEERGISECNTK